MFKIFEWFVLFSWLGSGFGFRNTHRCRSQTSTGQCAKTYELVPGETRTIIIKRVNFHCRVPLFVGYHLVISSSSAFVSNEGGLPDQYLSFIQQRACL
jgi:hypothetical protein